MYSSGTKLLCFLCFSGTKFLCSVLVAPVKNENNDIVLFILNLEDITDAPLKSESQLTPINNTSQVKNIKISKLAKTSKYQWLVLYTAWQRCSNSVLSICVESLRYIWEIFHLDLSPVFALAQADI